MAEEVDQLPPGAEELLAEQQEADGSGEVPSVMSVTTRYLIGRVDVTPPAEDGSRVMRLFSGNGATIIEGNLSPQICEFIAMKLTEVEVITQDAEQEKEEPDAGHGTD